MNSNILIKTESDEIEGIHLDFNNNSDVLLISFGGLSEGMGIPPYEFLRIASEFNVQKIFLRDSLRSWYQRGIKGIGNNIDRVANYLQAKIDEQKFNKIITTGNSAGGYAAILFGYLLEVDSAIAFSPQTFIDEDNRTLFGERRWGNHLKKLHEDLNGSVNTKYFDLINLWQEKSIKTNFHIHFSRQNHLDVVHSVRMQGCQNVNLFAYDGNDHNVVKVLRDSGLLKQILLQHCSL
jgi:hypothetical protein